MIAVREKTILITGAGGGIGQALCQLFGSEKNRIIVLDRDQDAVAAVCTALHAQGATATGAVADITVMASVMAALEPAMRETGPVDVLINNAGGLTGLSSGASLSLGKMTPEVWAQDVALNLNGAFHCVEAVRQGMIAQGGGVIINIGSVNSLMTFGCPAYSAAKAGLASYTRALATEFGQYNIRANTILPGTVRTDAWETMEKNNPGVFEQLLKWYPLRRICTPEDVAHAAYFLASDAARTITGTELVLDAGLTAGNGVMAAEITSAAF
ncbi:SDR family oxidoreductase [Collimonas sp.]|jgi:NAD(P)-dependent dehydrogenase (short-subunit alcohol dehydrogenase family)|uniref:SDR family oxidoreductase n=1 Tax=Collimonas sp. TaxID=1963772 RepID=UPI002BF3BCD5|nr:SDR family oxidoreductase [Collimonas sp.]HWW99476.1 SDR family oxidoreductase [Collimonas sp.]